MMCLHTESESKLRKTMLIRCALTAVVIAASYLLVRYTGAESDLIRLCAVISMVSCVLFFCPFFTEDADRGETLAKALLYIGIILRIAYMLYTPWYVRVHDVERAELTANGGGAYLLGLIKNRQLPQSNDWQFYQQPLYFMISAAVSCFLNTILGTKEELTKLVDAAKTVSCFAACASLYGTDMLLDVCGVSGRKKWIGIACVAFLPACILAGGMICTDAMTMLMSLLMLIETFCWYKKPDLPHTILLAIVCGLAVLTKISCAALALYTAIVMIVVWIRSEHKPSMTGKYLLFGCIALPLGLWYSWRNYRLFGQPLLYVAEVSTTNTMYCGNRSLVSRLLPFDFADLLATPYAHPYGQYNLPLYLLKSALFGEYTYENVPVVLPCVILALGCALAICILIAMIRALRRGSPLGRQFPVLLLFYLFLSTIFVIRYPFGFSQDFRYYLIIGVFAALTVPQLEDPAGKEGTGAVVCLMCAYIPCCVLFFLLI